MRVALIAVAFCIALLPRIACGQDFAAAFTDFDTGSDDPIQIEADRLEIRDVEKIAIYSGHVRVRQGDTVLETAELRISYQGATPAGAPAGSAVTRIEAGPGVAVRSGDQTATGNHAVFDMTRDLVTLEGDVVITQGANVVRGDRLFVNLATKQGRVEGGRVQTLITPSDAAGTE
jgi:lipopolysaccharide export system protein LptA